MASEHRDHRNAKTDDAIKQRIVQRLRRAAAGNRHANESSRKYGQGDPGAQPTESRHMATSARIRFVNGIRALICTNGDRLADNTLPTGPCTARLTPVPARLSSRKMSGACNDTGTIATIASVATAANLARSGWSHRTNVRMAAHTSVAAMCGQ